VENLNDELGALKTFNRALQLFATEDGELASIGLSPDMTTALKYAPMTTADTEVSFSLQKSILFEC
jgi:hypothetical protein